MGDPNLASSGKQVRYVTQRPLEVEVDSRVYSMSRKIRQAIIFNHNATINNGKLKPRPGTEYDVQRLQEALDLFQFTVTVYQDLTRSELLRKLEELQAADYENCDCLAIFVLTHGGVKHLAAQDKGYEPEELWHHFHSEACPTLAGKPKLFFINACRGAERDFGVEFAGNVRIDGPGQCDVNDSYQIFYTIPKYADILIAFSSFNGHISHRPPAGSWFIQALCDVLMDNNYNNMEIKQLLTVVTHKVALMTHYKRTKQVPVVVSTLIRDLYLC